MTEKNEERFMKEFLKMEPIQVIGLAHLFGIDLQKDKKVKDPKILISEIIEKYSTLSNTKQKEIIKIMQKERKLNNRR